MISRSKIKYEKMLNRSMIILFDIQFLNGHKSFDINGGFSR